MLFANIKSNGDLIIRATEEIEDFALKQWEKSHKSGQAKLVIETGDAFNMQEVVKLLGGRVAEFQKWWREQENKVVIPELSKVGKS